jgi:hypothetical protein
LATPPNKATWSVSEALRPHAAVDVLHDCGMDRCLPLRRDRTSNVAAGPFCAATTPMRCEMRA